jgi:hypothetical protein
MSIISIVGNTARRALLLAALALPVAHFGGTGLEQRHAPQYPPAASVPLNIIVW